MVGENAELFCSAFDSILENFNQSFSDFVMIDLDSHFVFKISDCCYGSIKTTTWDDDRIVFLIVSIGTDLGNKVGNVLDNSIVNNEERKAT